MPNSATRNPLPSTASTIHRILLIDDDLDQVLIISNAMRQVMSNVLLEIATTVSEAQNYLNNCQQNASLIPTVVLLDLYLPDREVGWQLLSEIRGQDGRMGTVPIIVLSHSMNRTDVTEAYDRGCSSYVAKPDTYEAWLTYLQRVRVYWLETVTLPEVPQVRYQP